MSTIFERISESDVVSWIEAKAADIQARTGLDVAGVVLSWQKPHDGRSPFCCRTVSIGTGNWSSFESLDSAAEELKRRVGSPADRAKAIRDRISAMIKEAEALEAIT